MGDCVLSIHKALGFNPQHQNERKGKKKYEEEERKNLNYREKTATSGSQEHYFGKHCSNFAIFFFFPVQYCRLIPGPHEC